MQRPKTILNFNISTDLKRRFHLLCRMEGKTMTMVLIQMIEDHLIIRHDQIADRQATIESIDEMISQDRYLGPGGDGDAHLLSIFSSAHDYHPDETFRIFDLRFLAGWLCRNGQQGLPKA